MPGPRSARVTLISAAAHPDTINTVRTYCYGTGDELRVVPMKDGKTDLDALREMLTADVASFYVQQPNFFGQLEDAEALGQLVHEAGAMYIMGCNPIALAIMKTPRDCGADIAVGEGQPLGMPLGYGGPYLGYMATTKKHMRKLPGRIVGETVDSKGERAYVLSLQAREQHIRREKASSNICSNEALCALTASVYMAAMGPEGMAEAARQCLSKAHYLAEGCAPPRRLPEVSRATSSTSSSPSFPGGRRTGRAGGGRHPGRSARRGRRAVVRHGEGLQSGAGSGRCHCEGGAGQMKLIFEKSVPGRRCSMLPACDVDPRSLCPRACGVRPLLPCRR